MRRKITAELEAWAARPNKKPLVLFGARQTGKTTSVLDFSRTHGAYADVIHIDFYKQPGLKAAFAANLDPRSVIAALEALLGREIPSGNTLLFLDEIQDCDQAITALKFFATDAPEYPVIAAGSLLGVHVARSGSFPVGYVDMLTMHPMDFEEFCWALGEERAFALARHQRRRRGEGGCLLGQSARTARQGERLDQVHVEVRGLRRKGGALRECGRLARRGRYRNQVHADLRRARPAQVL